MKTQVIRVRSAEYTLLCKRVWFGRGGSIGWEDLRERVSTYEIPAGGFMLDIVEFDPDEVRVGDFVSTPGGLGWVHDIDESGVYVELANPGDLATSMIAFARSEVRPAAAMADAPVRI